MSSCPAPSEDLLGEENHGDGLTAPLRMPEDPQTALTVLDFPQGSIALPTPRYWWFLGTTLTMPPRTSMKRRKFSMMSRNRIGSHVPRRTVSREITPSSPSLLIFFQSLKWPQSEVMLPTLASLPLDRMMKALNQKSCGMVSL